MPLLPGKKNLGANIKELSDTGRPHDQVLAIALKAAGMSKPKSKRKKKTSVSAETP
jgi:hypothetical protein